MTQARQPITEAGFTQNPYGQQYYDYARHVVGSLISGAELKWHPGRTGISLDDFVHDVSINAIEQTEEVFAKGNFNEKKGTFKSFFYWQIFKAFHDKLKELGEDTNRAEFDERLGKYYEGTAIDFGPTDENDDLVEKPNEDVVLYYYSKEKAAVLKENYLAKMEYVKKILDIVKRMSPSDQRLFYLKYQLDFSDEDYKMWKSIKDDNKHVKDPFTKMAHQKLGLSESYAKKRISQIKTDIIAKLNHAGHTKENYKHDTSMPTMLQALTVNPMPVFDYGLDIENLSEADCRDILFELFY